jgi:hypothetical protein
MASSTICDFQLFVWWRDPLPDVNVGVERLNFSMYGSLDLLHQINFRLLLMVATRRLSLQYLSQVLHSRQCCFVLSNPCLHWSDCSVAFPDIVVLLFLPMVIDYLHAWYLQVYLVFSSYLQKKYKIMSWLKKKFIDACFLYYIYVFLPYTIYLYSIYICVILNVKKRIITIQEVIILSRYGSALQAQSLPAIVHLTEQRRTLILYVFYKS